MMTESHTTYWLAQASEYSRPGMVSASTRIARCFKAAAVIAVAEGAGFIGSNFVIDWIAQNGEPVLIIDKLLGRLE